MTTIHSCTYVSRNPPTHFVLLILLDECTNFSPPFDPLLTGLFLVHPLNLYLNNKNEVDMPIA